MKKRNVPVSVQVIFQLFLFLLFYSTASILFFCVPLAWIAWAALVGKIEGGQVNTYVLITFALGSFLLMACFYLMLHKLEKRK